MRTRLLSALCLITCFSYVSGVQAAADVSAGKAVFERICISCHMANGQGLPGAFPPLAQSDFFKKAKPEHLVKIMQNGLSGEIVVNGVHHNSVMPPPDLTEQETADVLNFVSVQLNGGKPILTPARVKAIRAAP